MNAQLRIPVTNLQHHVFYVTDLERSKAFYIKLFDLQFSALNHPDSSAAMRLSQQEMHFFSFGFHHHDICLVKHHKLKMDNNSMLHFALTVKDAKAFDEVRTPRTRHGLIDPRRTHACLRAPGLACLLPSGPGQALD